MAIIVVAPAPTVLDYLPGCYVKAHYRVAQLFAETVPPLPPTQLTGVVLPATPSKITGVTYA